MDPQTAAIIYLAALADGAVLFSVWAYGQGDPHWLRAGLALGVSWPLRAAAALAGWAWRRLR